MSWFGVVVSKLAGSKQSDNPVPLVLLANHGVAAYSGPNLANIFAQVTTSATPLDSLHDEWLTFAFDLKAYAPSQPRAQEHHDAMEAVARLCEMPTLPGGQTNPFFSQVECNHHSAVAPAGGGCQYTCIELKELVRRHYFSAPATQLRLRPQGVGVQIGLAYTGLQQSLAGAHAETVFFGDADHAQGIMQDVCLVGVFPHRLVQFTRPSDVEAPACEPVVSDDSVALPVVGQIAHSGSKRPVAANCQRGHEGLLRKAIVAEREIGTIRYRRVPSWQRFGTRDRVLRADPYGAGCESGTDWCRPIHRCEVRSVVHPRVHVKLGGKTMNVGRLTAIDRQSPPGRLVICPIGTGFVLNAVDHANPVELIFRIELYGGNEEQAQLDVTW